MRRRVLRTCSGLAIAVLVALAGAIPLLADQPDFDFKLDVQPPQNVGDQFVITLTATQLVPNADENSTIRVIGPDGQVLEQPLPDGSGATVPGGHQTVTYWYTPVQNGEYTIQAVRVLGDSHNYPYPPDALQVVAETRVSTDKAPPGFDNLLHAGVNVIGLTTSPDPPLAGQPAQVTLSLLNTGPDTTDAEVVVSVRWPDGSADQPVQRIVFKSLQPGLRQDVPFTWTPSQAVDGAEMDASVSGGIYTRTWGNGADQATTEGDGP